MKRSAQTSMAPLSRDAGCAKTQAQEEEERAWRRSLQWLSAWCAATVLFIGLAGILFVWAPVVKERAGAVIAIPVTVWLVAQFAAVIAGYLRREWGRVLLAQLSALYFFGCGIYVAILVIVAKNTWDRDYFGAQVLSAVLDLFILTMAALSWRHFTNEAVRRNFR